MGEPEPVSRNPQPDAGAVAARVASECAFLRDVVRELKAVIVGQRA